MKWNPSQSINWSLPAWSARWPDVLQPRVIFEPRLCLGKSTHRFNPNHRLNPNRQVPNRRVLRKESELLVCCWSCYCWVLQLPLIAATTTTAGTSMTTNVTMTTDVTITTTKCVIELNKNGPHLCEPLIFWWDEWTWTTDPRIMNRVEWRMQHNQQQTKQMNQ
jgi:hypothetical protein